MNKNEKQIRQVIREEVRSFLIKEAFGSKILTKIHSTTVPKEYASNKHTNKFAFSALSKRYSIKWDNITDNDIKKGSRLTKKGLEFIVATKDGSIRPSNNWATMVNIKKGQMLGVSMDGKRVWMGGGYNQSTARTGQGKRSGNIGLDARGFNKLDQLLQIDAGPIVLSIDHKAGGSASEDRASREEAKSGATALISAKKALQDNKDRYEAALKKAAGAKGIGNVTKLFDDITKLYVKVLAEKTNKLKQGYVADGWNTNFSLVSNAYTNMTRSMENLLRYSADVEHEKSKDIEPSSWAIDAMNGYAKEIQDTYKKMKRDLTQLAKNTKYKQFNKANSRY